MTRGVWRSSGASSSSTAAKKASRSRCATITLRRLRIEEAGELLALPLREVEVERVASRLEVLRPPRADDDGGDERIREQPGERQSRGVDAAGAGLLRKPAQAAVGGGVHEVAVLRRSLRHPRARRRRLAFAVLAGQPATGKRAERGEAEPVLLAERKDLGLGAPLEQRVRVLHPFEAAEAAAGAGHERLGQPRAVDVARPDGPHLALADQLLEGLETALDRRVRVRLVRQVHVDPLDAEPGEAAVELPADPVRREAAVFARVHRVVDLRGELDPLADLRAFRAEPVADVGLAPPAAVGVRGVEGRDPELPSSVHEREGLVARLAVAEELRRRADPAEVPAAEDDPRDLEAAPAERTPIHRPILGWPGRAGGTRRVLV